MVFPDGGGEPRVLVHVGEEKLIELEGMPPGLAAAVAGAIDEAVDALLRVNCLRPVFRSDPSEMLDRCEGGPLIQAQLDAPNWTPP